MLSKTSLLLTLGALASVQACTGPNVNQATVDLITGFESFSSTPYQDDGGHWTIGYGHKCKDKDCSNVKYPKPLSKADGKKQFSSDLSIFQNCIATMTKQHVTLNANQYGAVVSWAFNIGCTAAQGPTLIKRFNNSENVVKAIDEELPRWNKVDSKPNEGLTYRRKKEVEFSHKATSEKALPAGC